MPSQYADRSPVSPSELALEGPFEHSWLHVRGIRLHSVQAGNPADPLLLFLHGGMGGWYDYRHVLAPIAHQGFHAVALDLRGYGLSDKPPAAYDIRTMVGDIYAAIRATGHNSAILIGHNIGGVLAWGTAIHKPECVQGIISIAAAHPSDLHYCARHKPWLFLSPLLRHISLRCPIWLYRILPAALRGGDNLATAYLSAHTHPNFYNSPAAEEELRIRELSYRVENSTIPRRRVLRLECGVVPSAWKQAPISCPTLLVQEDSAAWNFLEQQSRTRVQAECATVHIPGSKNMPHLEKPEEFQAVVLDFARRYGRSS